MMDASQVEKACVEKGLDAPRVTKAQIDALMASLTYKVTTIPGTTVTVCAALMPDGYMVGIGYSACVSPANFNEEIGNGVAARNAKADAEKNLWQMEGYVLRHVLKGTALLAGFPALRESE